MLAEPKWIGRSFSHQCARPSVKKVVTLQNDLIGDLNRATDRIAQVGPYSITLCQSGYRTMEVHNVVEVNYLHLYLVLLAYGQREDMA